MIKGVIFYNTLLHTVNRYPYVREKGTFLLQFFIEKEY